MGAGCLGAEGEQRRQSRPSSYSVAALPHLQRHGAGEFVDAFAHQSGDLATTTARSA